MKIVYFCNVSKFILMKELLSSRKQKIIEFIASRESMSVKELSNLMDVSEVTIRTDLDVLEKNGKIIRYHGGARLIENRHKHEFDYQIRKNLNFQLKKKIGSYAAKGVNSNEVIVMDASTTAFAMGQDLRKLDYLRYVTVIPFGIWTGVELLGNEHFNILLPGGYLRHATASLSGTATLEFFEGIIIHKAFLGAWGISIDQGITDQHLEQVDLKKLIVQKAEEVIIMVDGSKFNQSGIKSYATVDQVSKIITDQTAPIAEIEKMRELGVEVIIAS